jgi:hypothetical protein
MSESNSFAAAMTFVIGALGLALRPDQLGVGLALGMLGAYLTPSESRTEAWLVPVAALFVCILAVQVQPHMPMGVDVWHPPLVMALAGAFSVPVLRIMQAVGAILPELAKRAIRDRLKGGRDG